MREENAAKKAAAILENEWLEAEAIARKNAEPTFSQVTEQELAREKKRAVPIEQIRAVPKEEPIPIEDDPHAGFKRGMKIGTKNIGDLWFSYILL